MESCVVSKVSSIFHSDEIYEQSVESAKYFFVKNCCSSVVKSIKASNNQTVYKASSFEKVGA